MMFNAFTDVDFSRKQELISNTVKREIDILDDTYVIGVDEAEFIEKLYDKHALDIVKIQWDEVVYDVVDRDMPLSRHPDQFIVSRYDGDQTVRRKCLVVQFPFLGNPELLKYRSRIIFGPSIEIDYSGGIVYFEIVCWDEANGDKYNEQIQNKILLFRKRIEENVKDWIKFNDSLKNNIRSWFIDRKDRASRSNTLLSKIEIPMRKKANIPSTFALPMPPTRRKIPVALPKVSKSVKEEYMIAEVYYSEILRVIHDVGKNMERYPTLYEDKNEEALRDYILSFLMAHFELDASAESFNKAGKTDILLRHKNENVFVAECKIWGGQKRFIEEDIPQLLKYLTWRDTKTALVIFVKEKGVTDILSKIDVAVRGHNNFLRSSPSISDAWNNYTLHLNGDVQREISMATIIYHLPN